ncbi:hypothetical protein ILUMI_05012 [Ignelater luminosus]|uniref:Uncharacterized protein n=1 Tax=Ignelater luminosus TaxID=2038154 RepID=A0A8K0DDC9_IGNLU|nr:hypothetical protein ILUMI_05012 [Ignelater luminosus]
MLLERRDWKSRLGDTVLRKEHHLSDATQGFAGKLASKYSGPCTISRVLSLVVYSFKDDIDKVLSRIHIKDLKRYYHSRDAETSEATSDLVQGNALATGGSPKTDGHSENNLRPQPATSPAAAQFFRPGGGYVRRREDSHPTGSARAGDRQGCRQPPAIIHQDVVVQLPRGPRPTEPPVLDDHTTTNIPRVGRPDGDLRFMTSGNTTSRPANEAPGMDGILPLQRMIYSLDFKVRNNDFILEILKLKMKYLNAKHLY